MPRYYVDLDNNRLVTGPQSTQLAPTPRLYQGDKPTLDVELLTRTNGVLGYYTSTASALNVRVGTLGGSAVASALTLSTVTLSLTATATAGVASPVTATGTATLLGSITATATAGVNSPTVITITPSVTTWSSGLATAYLGPEAIAPVVKYSLTPVYDKYLDVVEAGTPYDASAQIYGEVTSVAQTFRSLINIGVPIDYITNPSTTHFAIFRTSAADPIANASHFILNSGITSGALVSDSQEFLTPSGTWLQGGSVSSLSQINLKNEAYSVVSYGKAYIDKENDDGISAFPTSNNTAWFSAAQTDATPNYGYLYSCIVLRSSQVSNALTSAHPFTLNGISVATLGINIGPAYVESYAAGYSFYREADSFSTPDVIASGGLIEVRSAVSAGSYQAVNKNGWVMENADLSQYSGSQITLTTETMPDGKKQISGGELAIENYQHRPLEALPKTGLVTIFPDKAYPGRRVDRIEVTDCGSQYASAPAVLVSEPENENGVTAKATAAIAAGKLSGITITDPGTGYSARPDVFVMPPATSMKSAAARTVTSVVTALDRRMELALGSGTTISDNSWCILSGLGKADGVAYVVTVATGGTRTTLKFPYNLGTVTSNGAATLTPLVPYVRVTGATITGTDASFVPGSTIPVSFSSPSCSDTDAVANFTVLNSGALALATIPTPGFANSFSVATLTAYKKVTGLTVTCAGAGYYALPTITVDNGAYVATAPGASPAVVTASLNGIGGIILTIVSAGYGYTSAPTITIAAPNRGDGVRLVTLGTHGVGYSDGTFACTVATAPSGGATAVINFVKSGTSQGFVVADPGRGYITAPAVTVPAPDLGGQVSGFTITSAGAGYAEAPSVTLTGGGGTGAAATSILTNGTVTSISLTSQGSGYTSAPAVALGVPPSSVYYSKQIDLSGASVTTLLSGNSSASAFLQVEEKRGSDTTVLAQLPLTVVARVS